MNLLINGIDILWHVMLSSKQGICDPASYIIPELNYHN